MKLTVNLPNTTYDILIKRGILAKTGTWEKELWKPQKIAII
ncbi:3-dehydroquinate synthase, partial [Streptococcus suis]